jgi:D-3-phosphoglycerate dehydrogenase
MLGMITEKVAAAGLNIENLVNKSLGEIAYTILDFNTDFPDSLAGELEALENVRRVRVL